MNITTDDWRPFLSTHRVGGRRRIAPREGDDSGTSRSEFHRDYDRIIFSSAFRSLSNKTQVVPFPRSDDTRQRLTHSLEVSCVGRSLAAEVYRRFENSLAPLLAQGDFEAIVATACLAHDIGNPPFGHFGERALQDWAAEFCTKHPDQARQLTQQERQDLLRFEGNAQAFRILTRLEMGNRRGGMRLTAATLGAVMKYPTASHLVPDRYKKHGYFAADGDSFREAVTEWWPTESAQQPRHPLAYLSEAADDICYAIIDVEDGCNAGLIPPSDALSVLRDMAAAGGPETGESLNAVSKTAADSAAFDELAMHRAYAINRMVTSAADVFCDQATALLRGDNHDGLVDAGPCGAAAEAAKQLAFEKVYRSPYVLERELAGYRAMRALMDTLSSAVLFPDRQKTDGHIRKLANLSNDGDATIGLYESLLRCTDIVAAMTDRRCLEAAATWCGHHEFRR